MKRELKLLLLSNYFSFFGFGLFLPVYALFVLKLGGSAFDAGSSWALYALVAGLAVLAFGRWEDRIRDKRNVVVIGYFLTAIGALSLYFVENIVQLYLAQTINAFGVGILFPAWKAVFSSDEDRGFEAGEWALFDGGNYVVTAFAALAGGYLTTLFDFKSLFLAMFGAQLVATLVSVRLLRLRK